MVVFKVLAVSTAAFLFVCCAPAAQADSSSVKKVNKLISKIEADKRKLASSLLKLTPGQFDEVVSGHADAEDSDGDHVPDLIESNRTDVCDGTTDGHSDRTRREIKDKLYAISDANLIFNRDHNTLWAVSISTVFEHGSTSNLVKGVCIEASGHVNALDSTKIDADKIEFKAASECR